MRVEGSGFRVQGVTVQRKTIGGCHGGRVATCMSVWGSGCRVQGSGVRVQASGFRVQGAEFKVQGSGFRVYGRGYRVRGSG